MAQPQVPEVPRLLVRPPTEGVNALQELPSLGLPGEVDLHALAEHGQRLLDANKTQ